MPALTGKIGISTPKESAWWSDWSIPAANALARADGQGFRRHAIEKKSPRKGTKTKWRVFLSNPWNYWKKVPEKGDENRVHLRLSLFLKSYWKKVPEKGDENLIYFSSITALSTNWKKVPEKGDENLLPHQMPCRRSGIIEKKSPRKGTKTERHFLYTLKANDWKKVPEKGDENILGVVCIWFPLR